MSDKTRREGRDQQLGAPWQSPDSVSRPGPRAKENIYALEVPAKGVYNVGLLGAKTEVLGYAIEPCKMPRRRIEPTLTRV